MGEDRIDVKVGAQTGELKTGMDQSEAVVKKATDQIKANFQQTQTQVAGSVKRMQDQVKASVEGVGTALSSVTKVAAGTAAILGGGAWLKGAVDEFVSFNSEVKKLSTTMGVEMQEAAAFGQAFKRVGVDADTLQQQLRMLERQEHQGGEAMKEMAAKVGVNIDFNEGLEKTYLKVLEALGKYKEGHDRNQASIDAFGMRVQISSGQLRVNAEAVEESRRRLESLGLKFDDISATKARKFKEGLSDVNLQYDAMKYKIGEVAIPALTSLGQAFIWVMEQARKMWAASANAVTSAEGAIAVLGGNAPEAPRRLTIPAPKSPERPGEKYEGGNKGGGAGGGKSRLQEWQQELEEMKVAEGAFLDYSKAQERAYWQTKLALCAAGSEEYRQIQHRVFQLLKEEQKEEVEFQISAIREKMESEKAHGKTRLEYEAEVLKIKAQIYGQDSLEYRREQQNQTRISEQEEKKRLQLKQNTLELQRKLQDLDLQMALETVGFRQQMGQLSDAQAIAALRKLKLQELQEERQSLEAKKQLWRQYPEEQKKIDEQILLLDKKKNLELQKLDQQYSLALKQNWDQLFSALSTSFNTAIMGMANGTMTFGQAMLSILQNVGMAIMQMGEQWLFKWISNWLYASIFGRVSAVERVTQEAGVAFAAAYAATCAIPIIGPVLAPEVAAAAAAGALSGGLPLASAAGGWEVPYDTLAYVHKDEKILPAWISRGLDNLIAGGQRPAAAAPAAAIPEVHLHFNLLDGRGVQDLFSRNPDIIVKPLQQAIRDGARLK